MMPCKIGKIWRSLKDLFKRFQRMMSRELSRKDCSQPGPQPVYHQAAPQDNNRMEELFMIAKRMILALIVAALSGVSITTVGAGPNSDSDGVKASKVSVNTKLKVLTGSC
jgi:hypothetical protein